jgi:hypothetical protein
MLCRFPRRCLRTTSLRGSLPARVRLGGGIFLFRGLPSHRAVRALAVVYAMGGWDAPALDFGSRDATVGIILASCRVTRWRGGARVLSLRMTREHQFSSEPPIHTNITSVSIRPAVLE